MIVAFAARQGDDDARNYPPRARRRRGLRRHCRRPRRLRQIAEVTRALPRTYSGTRLNLAWGTGQVNATMADFSREFTDATGIDLQFTALNSDDLQQKTILDTATKTNAFDIYSMPTSGSRRSRPTSPTSPASTSR